MPELVELSPLPCEAAAQKRMNAHHQQRCILAYDSAIRTTEFGHGIDPVSDHYEKRNEVRASNAHSKR